MSIERTGIVEEGQRRLAQFQRHIDPKMRLALSVEAKLRAKISRLEDELAQKDKDLAAHRGELKRIATRDAHIHDMLRASDIRTTQVVTDFTWMQTRRGLVPVESIVAKVSLITDRSLEELLSLRRAPPLAHARQFGYWLIRQARPDLTSAMVGHSLNRDVTTVKHGIQRVERDKNAEPFAAWIAHSEAQALLPKAAS